MKIKDIKVGDKVQLRKDIPEGELTKILGSHGPIIGNAFELQRRGEVTVKGIQEGIPGKEGDDWDSITLKGIGFYWPIEIFEPVNKPNKVIKSKEEQVQEDIERIKDIIKRYNLKNTIAGAADSLVRWLERSGQDNLPENLDQD